MQLNNSNVSPSQQVQLVENQNIRIYYQRSTSNTSFVEMSNYLKAIGIKNNRFMLSLLDPDLANIDPHDPNISYQYKMKVLAEVRNNCRLTEECLRSEKNKNRKKWINKVKNS